MTGDDDQPREYQLPRGAHISVQEGERVKAGEALMDGPIDPHDILRVKVEKELQRYLVEDRQISLDHLRPRGSSLSPQR